MMLRAAWIVALFAVLSWGCRSDFSVCLQKARDLDVVTQNDTLQIPIARDTVLTYTQNPPQNARRYDPFLRLALQKSTRSFSHPFKLNKYLPLKPLAAVGEDLRCVAITKDQNGLESFARLNTPLRRSAILVNGCCELAGIATPQGVIQKRFIVRFLTNETVRYGDFGIRLERCNEGFRVVSVNPFWDSPFEGDDVLVSIDGRRFETLRQINEAILFFTVGSTHRVEVLRRGKKKTLLAKVFLRKGGGFLSDTYLENIGVYLDANLHVIRSSSSIFRPGDRIFSINAKRVRSFVDIRKALTASSDTILVGLNRNGLDLFVRIPR